MGVLGPFSKILLLVFLGLGAASSGGARPAKTPLAPLIALPQRRAEPQPSPHILDRQAGRLTPLTGFELVRVDRTDRVSPRAKAVVGPGHGFQLAQGCLVYETLPPRSQGETRGVAGVRPVGTARVIEAHPLPRGRTRLVFEVRTRDLAVLPGPKGLWAQWDPGKDPKERRLFVYPWNFSGIWHRDYDRLRQGKIWQGMERTQLAMVMGRPARAPKRRTPFGSREVWIYPVTREDETKVVLQNGQVVAWQDSWRNPVTAHARDDWDARPTRSVFVGAHRQY